MNNSSMVPYPFCLHLFWEDIQSRYIRWDKKKSRWSDRDGYYYCPFHGSWMSDYHSEKFAESFFS